MDHPGPRPAERTGPAGSIDDARLFNASLPCRARLVGVEDEPGAKALASLRTQSTMAS